MKYPMDILEATIVGSIVCRECGLERRNEISSWAVIENDSEYVVCKLNDHSLWKRLHADMDRLDCWEQV